MRKLWNRPNLAVWSLVTKDASGVPNMNICTYVSSISMDPKLMLIALYTGTKTLQNVEVNKQGLLQLLTEDLAPVVRVCGQMSGHTIDKLSRLQKRYALGNQAGLPYLADAAGYMELTFTKLIANEGDHVLGLATVTMSKNLHDRPILTTDYLKEHKFTR